MRFDCLYCYAGIKYEAFHLRLINIYMYILFLIEYLSQVINSDIQIFGVVIIHYNTK